MTNSNDDWKEWSQYVRIGLTELKDKYEKMKEDLLQIRLELVTLKVKIAIWGAIGAIIGTGVIELVIDFLKKKGAP